MVAVEQRQPLLRRVLDKLTAARGLVGPAALTPVLPRRVPSTIRTVTVPPRTICVSSSRRRSTRSPTRVRAVILAHAASMALAKRRDVVRVLVTASDATRAERLAATHGLAADAAAAEIAASDRHRRDYFQRFYDVAEELPTHYDLVINTDVLTPEHAADAIACVACARARDGSVTSS